MSYERMTKKGGFTKDLDLKQEMGYSHIYNRLAELEDKLESGQLLELPCELGENFVVIDYDYGFGRARVESRRIVGYSLYKSKCIIYPVDQYGNLHKPDKVFPTQSQAEARLKELQEKV